MQKIKVQPFSQYTNWFHLQIGQGSIYKWIDVASEPNPANDFFKYRDEFYCLASKENCEPISPEGEILRRAILHAFQDALRINSFSFKGQHREIAFWNKQPSKQPHNDVFSAYTASFEYRLGHYWDGEGDRYYLAVDPHVAFTMNLSIEELVNKGIDASKFGDLSVKVKRERDHRSGGIDDFLLETQNNRAGQVQCRVINFISGEERWIEASHVYLEPRPEIIRSVLSDLGHDFDVVRFQQEKSFLSSPVASKDRFQKTQEIVRDYLAGRAHVFPLQVGGMTIEIELDPVPVTGSSFPRARKLTEPLISFDKADSSAVHLQAYWGLRTFGPYTKNRPTIKLALLGTKAGVQQLRDLINQLNRGTRLMPGGMRQFFNTRLEVIEEEVLTSDSLENYIRGAQTLGVRSERNREVDTVLVHLSRGTSDFELDTPYYNVKPILLEHGLPSQMITAAKLSGANAQWIHADIASGIFAKSGGQPWVLANDIQSFDMILGVGLSEAISKTRRAGAHPRFLGFANVFDEQGRWMFFESTSKLYDSNKHPEQLTELVSEGIDRYEVEQGRKPKSIAIHYYKRFSRAERDLVSQTLSEKIGDHQVAFITIDKSHPMRLYDILTQDGSFPRAQYAQVSNTEFLLSTTGFTELSKKRLGTPQILKVSVTQSPEDFVDLESIAAQILALTRLNYKTMTPAVGEPVTLLFSNLVAKFMAVFSEHQWKEARENRASKLSTRPWFL